MQRHLGTVTVLFSGLRFNGSLCWRWNRGFAPTWSTKELFIYEISQPLDNLPTAFNRTLAVSSDTLSMYTWRVWGGGPVESVSAQVKHLPLRKEKNGKRAEIWSAERTVCLLFFKYIVHSLFLWLCLEMPIAYPTVNCSLYWLVVSLWKSYTVKKSDVPHNVLPVSMQIKKRKRKKNTQNVYFYFVYCKGNAHHVQGLISESWQVWLFKVTVCTATYILPNKSCPLKNSHTYIK